MKQNLKKRLRQETDRGRALRLVDRMRLTSEQKYETWLRHCGVSPDGRLSPEQTEIWERWHLDRNGNVDVHDVVIPRRESMTTHAAYQAVAEVLLADNEEDLARWNVSPDAPFPGPVHPRTVLTIEAAWEQAFAKSFKKAQETDQ